MNGAHDLGGQMGFGPVMPEVNEPIFHAHWERRALGITLAMGALGQWNIDQSRAARESMPPALYLSSSYYAIWLSGLRTLMLQRGLISDQEWNEQHGPALARTEAPDALTTAQGLVPLRADAVDAVLAKGSPTEQPSTAPAAFTVGQSIRTRQMHPQHHTRLPRYARARRGVIHAIRQCHWFADERSQGRSVAQWLYTVRFDARELWGTDTTADSVCLDLWESYLEPI